MANTFSILVGQRARELGLLRAVGAGRAQLAASVMVEAAVVGLVGSVAGVVLGIGAAKGLLALVHGAGVDLPAAPTTFRPRTAALGVIAGTAVTVLAATAPALRATRRTPTEGTARARLVAGGAATLIGLTGVVAGVTTGSTSPILGGAAGVLVGVAALTPYVARPAARALGRPLVRILGEPAALGRQNAMRSPRRTASTAGALAIGIGLIGLVAILAASVKASATRTVDASLRADFVLTSTGPAGGVPPVVVDRLRDVDGVAAVSEILGGQWGLDGRTQTLVAVDPATVATMHKVDPGSAAALARLDDGGVLVRDTTAERYGWSVGDTVPMTFARTGTRPMRVAGTFSSTAVRTDYVISLGSYRANFAQPLALEVDVALAPGISPAEGRSRIEAAVAGYPVVRVMDHGEVLAAQEEKVNSLLLPVTALLALSVLIALLGIANTLALSVHERTRELGLLRAIGMGRRQLRQMIRSEAAIIAGLGACLGVGVALFLGWALVASMHGRGVTELVFPLAQLLGLVTLATVAGMLAGTLPARRAASLGVLDAVGTH